MKRPRSNAHYSKLLTVIFFLFPLVFTIYFIIFHHGFVAISDGFSAILIYQYIGLQELFKFNFSWTNKLGIGYPIAGDLSFQQLNPLNLLYFILPPIKAFHTQVVLWLFFIFPSSYFSFRYLFKFGVLETTIYIFLVSLCAPFFNLARYQIIFLSTFSLLPIIWYSMRRAYNDFLPRYILLYSLLVLLLTNTQFNFTLVPNFFLLGIILLYEHLHACGSLKKSFHAYKLLILLGFLLILSGIFMFYFFDVLSLTRHSNRAAAITQFPLHSFQDLWKGFSHLINPLFFDYPKSTVNLQIRPWIVYLVVLCLITFKYAKRLDGISLDQHRILLIVAFLLIFLTVIAPVFISTAEYSNRVVIVLFSLISLWIAGFTGRVINISLENLKHIRTILTLFLIIIVNLWFWHFSLTFWNKDSIDPHLYQRTKDQVRTFFNAELTKDLNNYRLDTLVGDGFIYTYNKNVSIHNLCDLLFEANWKPMMGFEGVSMYGGYTINPKPTEGNYKNLTILNKPHLPSHFMQTHGYDRGNLTYINTSSIQDPLFALLNIKYFFAPELIKNRRVTLLNAKLYRSPICGTLSTQGLYEYTPVLPRVWAASLQPLGWNTTSLSDLIIQDLADLKLQSVHIPLGFEHSGSRIRVYGLEKISQFPALVFLSFEHYPGWKLQEGKGELYNLFGMMGVVLSEPAEEIVLHYHTSNREARLLGAFSVLLGFLVLWRLFAFYQKSKK